MGLRENFQKLIERKQAEIRELEVRIREAQSYLQALQDSAKLLPKEVDNNGVVSAYAQVLRSQRCGILSRKSGHRCT